VPQLLVRFLRLIVFCLLSLPPYVAAALLLLMLLLLLRRMMMMMGKEMAADMAAPAIRNPIPMPMMIIVVQYLPYGHFATGFSVFVVRRWFFFSADATAAAASCQLHSHQIKLYFAK